MLFKGDILVSPSGGANVIFTDVETLKIKTHEKPPLNKRNTTESNPVESRAALEDRV